jgi:hypothetical protein
MSHTHRFDFCPKSRQTTMRGAFLLFGCFCNPGGSIPLDNSKRSRGDDFVLRQKRVRYDHDLFGEVTCGTSTFPEVIKVEDKGICVELETHVTSTPNLSTNR